MMLHLGVDIGGTFTDVVAREDGETRSTKVPTTDDLVQGVRTGVREILAETTGGPADVDRFVHGTTAGTNAVIEQEGGTVGLLMTDGFRDVLAIGRQKRRAMYDLFLDSQTPTFLAPRERRLGITERLNPEGEVLEPLAEDQVRSAVDELVEEHGVDAVGICYLFAFANSAHEERTAEIIADRYPEVAVSRSSEINPKFREYERLVVTAFDAYLRPVIHDYIARMEEMLNEEGITADLQVMQSRGGLTRADQVLERPVSTVLSGPAAGVTGAAAAGGRSGLADLITLDMGGTSADVSLIQGGEPHISDEGELLDYPLRMQMVDINTIGSGGGSIAWLDETDALHVGPQSAGADPGPACYGQGGTRPTVTDASAVLGYLNPEYFAGGTVRLDVEAAREAIRTAIAEPLEYSVIEAAKGIHDIVNTHLAEQLRLTTVRRGLDPRDFDLFAMGGAGPAHAGTLAERLDIPRVVVPPNPGVLSASGLHSSDIEHDHERTIVETISDLSVADLESAFADLVDRGDRAMHAENVPTEDVTITREADMRYQGQSFEIELSIPESLDAGGLETLRARFHDQHERVYGHSNPGDAVEFVNLRVVHTYEPDKIPPTPGSRPDSLAAAAKEPRELWVSGWDGPLEAAVYDRRQLPFETQIEGPAVIEQADTTVLVYPTQTARVDAQANLIISTAGD